MASGNGLPPSSALVVKRPSALGPFPRYVWIHQDTPQDSLDKICHDIWKRVQGLPESLQPRTSLEKLSEPTTAAVSFQEEALELSSGKDEISLLVEQEFLSLTKEHLILVQESSGELATPTVTSQGTQELAPCFLVSPLETDSTEFPGSSRTAGDKFQEQKLSMPIISSRQDCDSAMSTVTGILHATKVKSVKGSKDKSHGLGASSSEISKLLAQFPLKSSEMSKAPDNKMVLEETKVIKDFLENSMFNCSGPREPMDLGPFLLLPPPAPPAPADKLCPPKRQLPVFAKICSKTEADPTLEGHHWIERTPATKELTKGQESLFLSQWPQSRKDTCEEGHSDSVGTISVTLPTKKPVWPAEKNLLYEILGDTKKPGGQLRLRSKVDIDGLDLKFKPPPTVPDKNKIKYAGNIFAPHFTTALTSTTLNQPLWLSLNCPPPPVFSSHSTFPQYQGLYPQRSTRMPYQQPVHPPLGCYSRQVTPYDPQHMGQQMFRSSYTPLMSYIPFVQPNCSYPQRTPQKLPANHREPTLMAGDGPSYLFPQGYGSVVKLQLPNQKQVGTLVSAGCKCLIVPSHYHWMICEECG
ncbi:hypothetical protein STEG23_010059 [Scotinomys teguina]